MSSSTVSRCPCGSDQPLADCCGRFYASEPALTPEALMRSRYSAFALGLHDYLSETWHASTRPAELSLENLTRWVHLEMLGHEVTGARGHVHFRATFHEGRRWGVLEENSRFVHEAGRWYYLDGTPSVIRLKPGRNDLCPCNSGRKLKSCCGR